MTVPSRRQLIVDPADSGDDASVRYRWPSMTRKDASTGASAGERRASRAETRAATEEALLQAALRILERDGVLAGLNMKEVAIEAGVNRGLIHRYYGSRRALLRAAIERGLRDNLPLHRRARPYLPMRKAIYQFRESLNLSRWSRLVTLLALDGDDSFDALAFGDDRIADAEEEKAAGLFADDVDIPVTLLEWDASILGYSILRRAASRQLGIPLRELDERMLAVVQRQASANARRHKSGRGRTG